LSVDRAAGISVRRFGFLPAEHAILLGVIVAIIAGSGVIASAARKIDKLPTSARSFRSD
jgi:hypothetical protein